MRGGERQRQFFDFILPIQAPHAFNDVGTLADRNLHLVPVTDSVSVRGSKRVRRQAAQFLIYEAEVCFGEPRVRPVKDHFIYGFMIKTAPAGIGDHAREIPGAAHTRIRRLVRSVQADLHRKVRIGFHQLVEPRVVHRTVGDKIKVHIRIPGGKVGHGLQNLIDAGVEQRLAARKAHRFDAVKDVQVFDETHQYAGIELHGVPVPAGAVIAVAAVQITAVRDLDISAFNYHNRLHIYEAGERRSKTVSC